MRFTSAAMTFFLWSAKSSAFGIAKGRGVPAAMMKQSRRQRYSSSIGQALSASLPQQCPSHLYNFRGGSSSFSTSTTSSPSSTSSTALNSAVASAETSAPTEIFRTDYKPLPFTVSKISMDFQIMDNKTVVSSELSLITNPASAAGDPKELVLDGDETCVKLMSMQVDGKELTEGIDYTLSPGKLTLLKPAAGSVIKTVVEIVPEDNTQLSGLYKSGPMYCTQCEAMGFRRITYYPDRPDNMAIFERVRIEADAKEYPVLLSNGNLLEEGKVEGGKRRYAVWTDPFAKPSYLFAAVAGNLGKIEDSYTTTSGRHVKLQLFSEFNNVGKLAYAMESLKQAMKWDEDVFGLEYDLDLFNIVAVDSFNMGAMENKGLNVFNTALVLADEKTAADGDFLRIQSVVGHEYFHNWTGNRVTCRDWFQLTLKEGLTVFRDQEFSGDMNSKAVDRIENVRGLRGGQFNQDAGPMAHPIRPDSYISMDNFYTATVYSKGAEVIRMYQTLLTQEGFRKGMDLYFERHDGSAVTCDDFLAAMSDANGVDLSQFARWYSTPGTPTVKYSTSHKDGTYSLTLTQSSKSAEPLHIPVSVGLLDKETGKEVVPTTVLNLKEITQTFTFENVKGDVVPSILRDFSAPIKLVPESGIVDEESVAFLAARDTDGFNRWDAGQKLFTSLIFQNFRGEQSDQTLAYVEEAFGRLLVDQEVSDYSIKAYALTLPSEGTLAEDMDVVDPIGLHAARGAVKKGLARKFQAELQSRYDELTSAMEAEGGTLKVDATSIGKRRLRNVLLEYLCAIKDTDEEEIAASALADNHFKKATGMSDKMAGLSVLASMSGKGAAARDEALQKFYDDAEGDALVLNKWFSVQALADLPDVLDRVKELKKHPDFTVLNPNRCRSLISAFGMNSAAFHAEDGSGYHFIGGMLAELDPLNPSLSSRMAGGLIQWRRYNEKRGGMMKAELDKLASTKLSDDLFEVVNRGLK